MAAQRVLPNDRLHLFRQTIEAAAHVGRFGRQPDPRLVRPIQRVPTRQAGQTRVSSAASAARRWSASKPGSTNTQRPLSRISMAWLCAAVSCGGFSVRATCISTNCPVAAWRNRFFQAKNCDAGRSRCRQNAATLWPLPACSDTRPLHFAHASRLSSRIPPEWPRKRTISRWGSRSAHEIRPATGARSSLPTTATAD